MALKRYRVIGTAKIGGYSPGETFEADFPPEQEKPLLQIGAVEVVVSHRDEKPKKQKEK